MNKILSAIILCFCCLVGVLSPAQAANTTNVFPPYLFGTTRLPAASDGECVVTYLAGQAATYCRTKAQAFDFVFPDQATAQKLFRLALPGCNRGQYLAFDGTNYVCKSIPSCTTNQFLDFNGNDFLCAPIVLPVCKKGEYLISIDGKSFACASARTCTPNWQVVGTGSCSASCGGGLRDVTWADGCGHTRTERQACNTQACPVQCNGTVINGYCFYLGDVGQSCDQVCAGQRNGCSLQGTKWAAEPRPNWDTYYSDNCALVTNTIPAYIGQTQIPYVGPMTGWPIDVGCDVGLIANPGVYSNGSNGVTCAANGSTGNVQSMSRRYCACNR